MTSECTIDLFFILLETFLPLFLSSISFFCILLSRSKKFHENIRMNIISFTISISLFIATQIICRTNIAKVEVLGVIPVGYYQRLILSNYPTILCILCIIDAIIAYINLYLHKSYLDMKELWDIFSR